MLNIDKTAKRNIYEKLPLEVEELSEDEQRMLNELEVEEPVFGKGCRYVKVGPKKFLAFNTYKDMGLILYNFEARPTDLWLFGCPRSGTTLVQEMLYLIGNDLDFEKASRTVLDHRFPVINHCLSLQGSAMSELAEKNNASDEIKQIASGYVIPYYKQLESTHEKRFIKCHLPLSLMSPHILTCGCKVVYCARNPKDVAVSDFICKQWFGSKINDFPLFWRAFQKGLVSGTPWFENVKEAWDLRNEENFLFLFYEDIIKDKRETLKKVAELLGKQLSEDDLDKLEDHLAIENFKKNKSVNNDHLRDIGMARDEENVFIRKGKSGGWKEFFSPQLAAEADKWIEENCTKYDITLPV